MTGQGTARLRLLQVLLSATTTSQPYNELVLPLMERHDLRMCSFFRPSIAVPSDLKHAHGNGSVTGFLRAFASLLNEGPFAAIHSHSPHVAALVALYAKVRRRPEVAGRTVMTVHSSYHLYGRRNRALATIATALTRRVVFVSNWARLTLPWHMRLLARHKARVVRNGVDSARIACLAGEPNGRSGRETNGLRITFIGRLLDAKGVLLLLEAFRHAGGPDDELVYIGEGPLRDRLLSEARQMGIGRQVRLTGLIPREEVYRELAATDVFVSPSAGEGLPVAPLEAAALGCPLVLSDIGPHREIVEGIPGLPLVRPGDVGGLAQAIREMKEAGEAGRAELGRRCRQRIELSFSMAAMHRQYEEIYAGLGRGR